MKPIASFAVVAVAAAAIPVSAQTRTVRQTATTYGARLNANAQPQTLNEARWNNRVNSRLNTRLGLRIERFRVGDQTDAAAAYKAATDDRSRAATVAPLPAPPTNQDEPQ